MSEKIKCVCGKEMTYKDCYRCRICQIRYCDECSLTHFGLHKKGHIVKHKNILKTIWWVIRRNLFKT
jgi:hypothetical protein